MRQQKYVEGCTLIASGLRLSVGGLFLGHPSAADQDFGELAPLIMEHFPTRIVMIRFLPGNRSILTACGEVTMQCLNAAAELIRLAWKERNGTPKAAVKPKMRPTQNALIASRRH